MTKAKPKFTDISQFNTNAASNRGAEMELKHPVTDEGFNIFIRVLGSESDEFVSHSNDQQSKMRQEMFKAKRGIGKADFLTSEQIIENTIILLTRCTVGWRDGDEPVIDIGGGELLTFNAVNCQRLYTEQKWVRDQVDAFIGEMANFL